MMDLKRIFIVFIFFVTLCSVHTNALPRDSSVIDLENVSKYQDVGNVHIIPKGASSEFGIPGRKTCPYDEPTEDSSCMEHCLPKGYSYGICVSGTCSCI